MRQPPAQVAAFRTRHLKELRKLAKRRHTTVSAVLEDMVEHTMFRTNLRAALNRCMDAVGDLAWTQLNTPERDAVVDRLTAALKDFEDALAEAGL